MLAAETALKTVPADERRAPQGHWLLLFPLILLLFQLLLLLLRV
jgi:hypothetical protein